MLERPGGGEGRKGDIQRRGGCFDEDVTLRVDRSFSCRVFLVRNTGDDRLYLLN